MGYRCHVATKYDVKYGFGLLSFQQEFVNTLLDDLCPGLWCNSEYIGSADELEIPKGELKEAIETVKENREEYEKDILENKAEVTIDELIESMETWLQESDSNNDFVRLSWF